MSKSSTFKLKKHKGKKRVWEMAKNLLIVLLLCSAGYLTVLTGAYDSWIQGSFMQQFLTPGTTVTQTETTTTTEWTADTSPIAMAVMGEDGRYGIQYSDETALVYQAFQGLLGEGLLSSTNLQLISEEDWQWALQQKGVYFSYLSDIPLSTLNDWVNNSQSSLSLEGMARQLILAQSAGDDVSLYYHDSLDGNYYVLDTAISYAGHMDSIVSNYKGNQATFAFEYEDGAGYDSLDSYVMLLSTLPTPTIYASTTSLDLENTTLLAEIATALDFHSQTSTQYYVPEGLVVRENEDVLRFEESGTLSYQTEDAAYLRFSAETQDLTAYIEICQTIVSQTIAPLSGEAQVVLSGITQTETGYTITFAYMLNGIQVQFSHGEQAAQFDVSNGIVTEFTLYFRSYTTTQETSMVLRESKAVAALSALNVEESIITLCYEDWGGDTVSTGWIAQ